MNTVPIAWEIKHLAENHLQNDLQDSDRDVLRIAASKHQTYETIGTILGLGLGVFFAFRSRRSRMQNFTALRTQEQPMHVVFADGRIEAAPDLTSVSKGSTLRHIAKNTLFVLGGGLFGHAAGVLTGQMSAARLIRRNPERNERFARALRKFRADEMRKVADQIRKRADTLYKE